MGWGTRSGLRPPLQDGHDHRTDYETSNAVAVLDGDLDGFMQAYLKETMGEKV
jgi:peptide chain release factor 2